jgi:hypothetical protein
MSVAFAKAPRYLFDAAEDICCLPVAEARVFLCGRRFNKPTPHALREHFTQMNQRDSVRALLCPECVAVLERRN